MVLDAEPTRQSTESSIRGWHLRHATRYIISLSAGCGHVDMMGIRTLLCSTRLTCCVLSASSNGMGMTGLLKQYTQPTSRAATALVSQRDDCSSYHTYDREREHGRARRTRGLYCILPDASGHNPSDQPRPTCTHVRRYLLGSSLDSASLS